MMEYTRRTQPIEKPSGLQLAIREWQRQLVDKARMGNGVRRSDANTALPADWFKGVQEA